MTDVVDIVKSLEQPKGFHSPYHADIVAVRDVVDPPVRSLRRASPNLSLVLDDEECGVRSFNDAESLQVVLAFGATGLIEVAQSIVEGVGSNADVDDGLPEDGLRFALMFQAGQAFINRRLSIDGDFTARFEAQLGRADRRSRVPYQHSPMRFPSEVDRPTRDDATQYRVGRFSSRIALDRLLAMPMSGILQNANNAGRLLLEALRRYHDDEVGSVHSAALASAQTDIGPIAQRILEAGDSYPLVPAALANPIKPGIVGKIALTHIGERTKPRPGWVSLDE